VRAKIVDGVVLAINVEYGHQPLADGERRALTGRNSPDSGDGDEFGH
jgi:hypothetical protein